MAKRKKKTARAKQGAYIRSVRESALRWAKHQEQRGLGEAAADIEEATLELRAGRGRSYSKEAKEQADVLRAEVARQKSIRESVPRFNREAAALRRGASTPLTIGANFTDLKKLPPRYSTFIKRHITDDGHGTDTYNVTDMRAYAARWRGRQMERLFYQANTDVLMYGRGGKAGGASPIEQYAVTQTTASSVYDAWRQFWATDEGQKALAILDRMAVGLAQGEDVPLPEGERLEYHHEGAGAGYTQLGSVLDAMAQGGDINGGVGTVGDSDVLAWVWAQVYMQR